MSIVIASVLLYGAVLVLGGLVLRRGGDAVPEALRISWDQALSVTPRIILAVIGAGFIAALVPPEWVAAFVGRDTGFAGLLLASLIGALTPGGPMLAFAVGGAAMEVGAGAPQMMAFVSAWSLFNFNRMLVWEFPIMGHRSTLQRFAIALPLPVLIGLAVGQLGLL
ncbi:hypothetical protein HBA54_19480 [Pelagibius litoralis]|uniref:Permease n=1 Tax=Pelagibius litoralis TaxID=374515 RepID=A0A967KEK2_9PROT|nr:permease [Pelagibius litoralis]NIA70785.1 hypothetical protein [Pelagibius litoralis]